jgi:hypothetical protein
MLVTRSRHGIPGADRPGRKADEMSSLRCTIAVAAIGLVQLTSVNAATAITITPAGINVTGSASNVTFRLANGIVIKCATAGFKATTKNPAASSMVITTSQFASCAGPFATAQVTVVTSLACGMALLASVVDAGGASGALFLPPENCFTFVVTVVFPATTCKVTIVQQTVIVTYENAGTTLDVDSPNDVEYVGSAPPCGNGGVEVAEVTATFTVTPNTVQAT